jgi:hypothetical protein
MVVIRDICDRIENKEGVDETLVDASDRVWIHIFLKKDADKSSVLSRLKSDKGLHLNFESTYEVGGGMMTSGTKVLKTSIS